MANERFTRSYEFGDFRVDGDKKILLHHGKHIHLPPKVFDTLLLLVENNGHLVEKDEILQVVWENRFVEENNLQQHISFLRKTLGDADLIKTVPKRGYRFTAPIRVVETETSSVQQLTEMQSFIFQKPKTHYAKSGDINIAYQVLGNGDIDIVFVMGWISHLEYFWEHYLFANFLNRLASFSRLILFDKRGTGLSDRVPLNELPTLEQRMDDVRAVMEAVGSEKAVLVGVSEGGPMCSLFAATYPEKTSALVMIGTYAKRIKDEDYPWGLDEDAYESFFETIQNDWGKAVGIEERAPSLAHDEEFRRWWATYLRMGASPGAAVALTKMNAEIDVRNVLKTIRVPTLVIHRSGDLCLKVEEGRYVAAQIPACKFVELDGVDHLPFVGNQAEILSEIEQFLTGVRYPEEFDRVLATVMSIKIADQRQNWQNFVKDSQTYIRGQLDLFKGRKIFYGDDGLLAVFDGPARAIRCACAINDAARRVEFPVKTGIHTGECEVIGDIYQGIAVEIARQIADESNHGEILASRTVKDLVAGSGLHFQERTRKSFAEINGEWKLFTVLQEKVSTAR
jgi:pimeloyl-ACP methyl ester carboxylesterase/DNA-binding winged helix-turn-helix (wHTH) protein